MSNEIRSQGEEVFVVAPGNTTPVLKIGNITQRGDMGGEPGNIPTTNLDSTRHTSIPGLESDTRFTVTVNLSATSEAHKFLRDNKGSMSVFEVIVADSQGTGVPTYSGGAVDYPTDRDVRHAPARIAQFTEQAVAPDGLRTVVIGFDMTDDWTYEDAE